MDQDAFRKLVSSSSAVAGPSTNPSSSNSSNRVFGKAHHKRNLNASSSSSASSTKPSDLKPLKITFTNNSNESYIDRAAARRTGNSLHSEFAQVEELHREFEERLAAAQSEEERHRLRDTISSVGGDPKYSVLVKGLDWALLAQNKAKLQKENGGVAESDDLESAYLEARTERQSTSEQGEDNRGTKRSRDDIIEAIKRRKEGKRSTATKHESVNSGFKPIGFKPIAISAEKPREDTAEYKWVNGKRMRRKKKHTSTIDGTQPQQPIPTEVAEEQNNSSEQISKRLAAPVKAADTKANEITARDIRSPFNDSAAPRSEPNAKSRTLHEEEQPRQNPVSSSNVDNEPASRPSPVEEKSDGDEQDIFPDVGGWEGIVETKEDLDKDGLVSSLPVVAPEAVRRSSTPPPSPSPPAPAPPEAVVETVKAVTNQSESPPDADRSYFVTDLEHLDATDTASAEVDPERLGTSIMDRPCASVVAGPTTAGTDLQMEKSKIAVVVGEENVDEQAILEQTSKSKPKKSKWDDLEGDQLKQKKKNNNNKKKKKHD
ncbi:uncharacterized protein MEPE_03101 [Melanopsichium pennsylvanicum]|uniref:RED-like N-terminal domain-containing protein n=1 Tax=Melanopsichium pennsylvanicum TaxID=63383 RepID=A0AAJ5C559_9BASI|nr:uncharacterized protein MEPE_03101 [Melanopsichium pennsylvanicum]